MTDAPTVLLLIESAGHGGAESVVLQLALGLRSNNVPVRVATFRSGWLTDSLTKLGIPYTQVATKRSFDLLLPYRLARLLKTEKISLLHSHLVDSNFYGALAARIAKIPHLATEHGDVHHTHPKQFLGVKLKTLSLLGSHTAVVSGYTKNALVAAGITPKKIHLMPNPINFTPAAPDARERIRANLQINGGPDKHWLWLQVANLRPVKDQPTLLRAFALARSQTDFPQSLCIVGGGDELPRLQSLARELEISDCTYFAGFQNNISEWLSAADGFVLSSRSEAMPVALLEAAAVNRVIVATAVGGIPEVITAETGYLVPKEDPSTLAKALVTVVSDQAQAAEKAARAGEMVRARFGTDAAAKSYLELYCSLCSGTAAE